MICEPGKLVHRRREHPSAEYAISICKPETARECLELFNRGQSVRI
jgi:hypothetical protein